MEKPECKNFRCDGGEVRLTMRTIKNGSKQFVHQCLNCGRTVGTAIAKAKVCGEYAVFDCDIETAWNEKMRQRFDDERAKNKDEFFSWYSVYLRSEPWRAKRTLVLDRANGLCEGCATDVATEVHHLTYDHVGDELLWELVAVCHKCHLKAHAEQENTNANAS